MKMTEAKINQTPSELISSQIAELADWRGELLARLRRLILDAAPGIAEEWKWGTPVWAKNGLVCSAKAFKDKVKLNFFEGAVLADPKGLFNAGLDAKDTRAIDFSKGEAIDELALKELVRAAVAHNSPAARTNVPG